MSVSMSTLPPPVPVAADTPTDNDSTSANASTSGSDGSNTSASTSTSGADGSSASSTQGAASSGPSGQSSAFANAMDNTARTYTAKSIGNSLNSLNNQTPTDNHQQAAQQSLQALGGDLSSLNANLGKGTAQQPAVDQGLASLGKDYKSLVKDQGNNDVGKSATDFSKFQGDLTNTVNSLGGDANGNKNILQQTASDAGYLQQDIMDQASDKGLIPTPPSTPQTAATGPNSNELQATSNIEATNGKRAGNVGLTQTGQTDLRGIQGDVQSIAANTSGLPDDVNSAVQGLVQDSGKLGKDLSIRNEGTKVANATGDVTKLNADVGNVVNKLATETGGTYGNQGALLDLVQGLNTLTGQLSAASSQLPSTPPAPPPAAAS